MKFFVDDILVEVSWFRIDEPIFDFKIVESLNNISLRNYLSDIMK